MPGGDIPNSPKLDTLITRAADDYIALRANSRVQHAGIVRVPDLANFLERGIRVDHDRIVREAVRGEKLFCERGELDRGDLRGCGERVEACARVGIPKVHGGIAGPSTGGEKGRLPWAPGQSLFIIILLLLLNVKTDVASVTYAWDKRKDLAAHFDCGSMVPLREFRCGPAVGGDIAHSAIPDIHNIIIRTAREAVSVGPPRQATHFARVALEDADFVLGDAHVVVPDAPVLAAAAQDVAVPAERRDACRVAAHDPQPPFRLDIPQLDIPRAQPDRHIRAVARPAERADMVALCDLREVRDRPRLRVPDVRVFRERDGEDVVRRPGEQVEVVIVEHRGRVEHAFWLCGEPPLLWTRGAAQSTAQQRATRPARRRLFPRV